MRKLTIFNVLVLCVSIAMFSGCGSSSSSSDDIISVTLNGVTTDFTAGPNDTGFDGIPAATLQSGSIWMIGMKDAGSYNEWSTIVDGIEIDFNAALAPGTINTSTDLDLFWLMISGNEYETDSSNFDFSVTVDTYDDVGGRVIGTFTGTVIDSAPIGRNASRLEYVPPTTYDISGSFNVKRYPDDSFPAGK